MRGTQSQKTDWVTLSTVLADNPRAVALVNLLRLHWFIRLRWLFFITAIALLAFEHFLLPDVVRPVELAALLVALGLANLAWTPISFYLFRDVQENVALIAARLPQLVLFTHAQVGVDLLLLTGILRYTGGAENPLAIFYLFHTAIVALVLKRWQAILQGAWALLLYAVMVVGEWQHWLTPHYGLLPGYATQNYADPRYVLSVLAVVALGVLGVLYFTLQIVNRLERRERDLQRTNVALQRSQQAIQDLQKRRSRFMQTAAHQLKTPLAVISTLGQLISTETAPREAIPGICEKIIRRCQEGITQVRELLTLARVQKTDPGRHRDSETDARAVVAELCNRFRPLAENKRISLLCRMPRKGRLTVRVDPQDLKDCIGNLIENAIKYTPAGGSVRVTVSPKLPRQTREVVVINVTDTGMGIDPALLRPADGEVGHEAVFDSFRRGGNVTAAGIPGTGLGLSIVREVVEQVGGRIRVTSRPKQGSSFAVTFPAGIVRPDRLEVRSTQVSEIVLGPLQNASDEENSPGAGENEATTPAPPEG